jgi:hypothetical protein
LGYSLKLLKVTGDGEQQDFSSSRGDALPMLVKDSKGALFMVALNKEGKSQVTKIEKNKNGISEPLWEIYKNLSELCDSPPSEVNFAQEGEVAFKGSPAAKDKNKKSNFISNSKETVDLIRNDITVKHHYKPNEDANDISALLLIERINIRNKEAFKVTYLDPTGKPPPDILVAGFSEFIASKKISAFNYSKEILCKDNTPTAIDDALVNASKEFKKQIDEKINKKIKNKKNIENFQKKLKAIPQNIKEAVDKLITRPSSPVKAVQEATFERADFEKEDFVPLEPNPVVIETTPEISEETKPIETKPVVTEIKPQVSEIIKPQQDKVKKTVTFGENTIHEINQNEPVLQTPKINTPHIIPPHPPAQNKPEEQKVANTVHIKIADRKPPLFPTDLNKAQQDNLKAICAAKGWEIKSREHKIDVYVNKDAKEPFATVRSSEMDIRYKKEDQASYQLAAQRAADLAEAVYAPKNTFSLEGLDIPPAMRTAFEAAFKAKIPPLFISNNLAEKEDLTQKKGMGGLHH